MNTKKEEPTEKTNKSGNVEKKFIMIFISFVVFVMIFMIITLIVSPDMYKGNSFNNSFQTTPSNTNSPPPEKKRELTPEEIKAERKKELDDRMKNEREESQIKYQEKLDERQKEIDKMSNLDYYMYHGNPNHLSFEELEKQRKEASEDYWKNKKK